MGNNDYCTGNATTRFVYDAMGQLTGNTMLDQYNAGQQMFHAYFNDAVMYVNPYFTISRRNYTRHIFNGIQRIATEIGTSDLSDCIDTTAAGMERLANARAYMQSLFAEPIELHSDTGTTFVDIAGDVISQDETIEKPWILIHTPINTVSECQKNGNAKINYNSKTDDTSW